MDLFNFHNSLKEIACHVKELENKVNGESIDQLIRTMLESDRIFVYGAGRSGLMGKAFAQRLMHIGRQVFVIGETLVTAMKKGDAFILISGSGQTPSTVCLAKKAKELGVKIVTITAHPESQLGTISDIIVHIPSKTKLLEKPSYAPFTALFDISVLAVLDSVISEVMSRLGLQEEDIFRRHANVE
ncbi:MAG: 6-phospho-3-hexuloisomerase [Desulfurococcaceae archaeon]